MSNTLYVIAEYRSRDIYYQPGKILNDLTTEERDFLLRDAPGCFSKTEPKEETNGKKKGKKKAPKDKAIKGDQDK